LKIINNFNITTKVISEQTVKIDIKYRPLIYLIKEKINNEHLIYNTLTKALILIDETEKDIFTEAEISYNSDLDILIKNWFLVPIDFDEQSYYYQINNIYKLLDHENYINHFTIFPTTDCNARCFYCFEKNKQYCTMTKEIALSVAEYIIKVSNNKKISLTWFGGEPLHNSKAINTICEKLAEENVDFSSSIITNGYLFNDKNVKLAKKLWNITSAQITLDGTEKIYNRVKNYIYNNDKSPFRIVLNNIEQLLDNKIKVQIRLNLDSYNKDDLYSLVDYLYKRFRNNKYLSIYVRLLFDDTSDLQRNRNYDERKEIFLEFQKLREYIISLDMYNIGKLKTKMPLYSCVADDKHSVIILPNGEFSVCDMLINDKNYGNIYDGITDLDYKNKFTEIKKPVNKCTNCVLKPICLHLSGCPEHQKDCEDFNIASEIYILKQQMKKCYKNWLELNDEMSNC